MEAGLTPAQEQSQLYSPGFFHPTHLFILHFSPTQTRAKYTNPSSTSLQKAKQLPFKTVLFESQNYTPPFINLKLFEVTKIQKTNEVSAKDA